MPRFSPRIENLELRRLMDADGIEYVEDVSTSEVATASVDTFEGIDSEFFLATDFAEPGLELQTFGAGIADQAGPLNAEHLSMVAFPSPRVFRSGSTVIAIGNSDYSGTQKLWAIREGDEVPGEIAFDLELGQLWIEQVLVDGDRLLVIGEAPWSIAATPRPTDDGDIAASPWERPGKRVLAVDLSTGDIVKEFELPPGFIKYADFSNGKATLIGQRSDLLVPAIWPPVETSDEVYRFTWNEDGISELQTDLIASGEATVIGDRVFVAVPVFTSATDDPSTVNERVAQTELRIFKLTEEGVEKLGTLTMDAGRVLGVQANESGDQVAVAFSSYVLLPTDGAGAATTKVLIVDLTDAEKPVIKETLAIPQTLALPPATSNDGTKTENDDAIRPILWYQPLDLIRQEQDYFVFSDASSQTLTIVDLGTEVTGDDRLRTVELPENIQLGRDAIRLEDDRIVFVTGQPYWALPFLTLPPDSLPWPIPRSGSNGLLTLSLPDGTIKVQDFGDEVSVSNLELIDADTGRFGFLSTSQSEIGRKFVFGKFDEEGTFVAEGELASDSYFQSIYPHADSITVATPGSLETYSYENLDEPLYVIRFTDENTTPLQANDDAIKLYSSLPEPADQIQSEWIDLLVNDQIPFYSQFRTRIVELIDAPEGVNIAAGRYVWLDSRIQSLDEPLVFKYKVSDGVTESVGEVEITLAEVTNEQREAMIDAIKSAVSRDYEIPSDAITVEPIALLEGDDNPWSLKQSEDGSALLLPPITSGPGLTQSPSFTFRVTAEGFKAFYVSDLNANVYPIRIEREEENESREPVIELSLAATDDEGNEVQSVEAGESFWLELRGKDLRADAKGVFSAFLNLTIPTSLSIEGTVEPGEGFSFIDADNVADKITGQAITSLGVLDADGALPETLGDASQVLLRVRLTATENGAVTLVAAPAQNGSEETTVFDDSEALKESQIKRTPLAIVIGEPAFEGEPTDVDGDGNVRAIDALRVINMVSRHGVGTVDEIKARMDKSSNSSGKSVLQTDDVRRFDVNRNGSITPLDALLVINHLSRESRRNASSPEAKAASSVAPNAEGVAVDPTFEEQELKRRRR
jgi:hypothetical protein